MLFYGDGVVLKNEPHVIGFVDRTFHDVGTLDDVNDTDLDSHAEPLDSAYLAGVELYPSLPTSAKTVFLSHGVPPRGWVVIMWPFGRSEGKERPTLMPESDLEIFNRDIGVGNVVKRRPGDSVSGVVTECTTCVDLLPPSPWPWLTPQHLPAGPPRPKSILSDIPIRELVRPNTFAADQFVTMRDWIGQVRDVWVDVTIQLKNGSVVTLEDSEEITWPRPEDVTPSVGDFIQTKKGNLRRGKWIFGAFDPNVDPSGYVLEVSAFYLEVEWLCQRYGNAGTSEPHPPSELQREYLETEDLRLYDAGDAHQTGAGDLSKTSIGSLQVHAGDKVRFRDQHDANSRYKHNMRPCETDGSQSVAEIVPRHKTLGYDLNVLTVFKVHTRIKVLWQDLSEAEGASTDFVPSLDLDDDEENVWPGDLVSTRETSDTADAIYVPSHVGIVQRVNSRDRVAQVRWFCGSVSFTGRDHSILLPGSYTGELQSNLETVSLYDITTTSLARTVGDLVTFTPAPLVSEGEIIDDMRGREYALVQTLLNSPSSNRDWVGEVVHLGLDGLLTIRLGASCNIREVRVPWECTYIAYGANDDESDDDEDDEADVGSGDSLWSRTGAASPEEQYPGVWFDEATGDGINDEQEAGWTTDEEGNVEEDDAKEDGNDAKEDGKEDEDGDGDTVMGDDPILLQVLDKSPSLSFSYAAMFPPSSRTGHAVSKPVAFDVLEEPPPSDHHFFDRGGESSLNGQRMRRIQKEHRILDASLPDGVWIRTWETATDLMRVLILGPLDTPYEYAPFVIDLHLDASFPTQPPKAFFHSWTQGGGPINPNLYEDGTICLSLLGTWPGDAKHDTWTPKSTILQLVVSLLGLVLVKEPFYNEAGYEIRQGTQETQIPSSLYSERTYIKCHNFIITAITHPMEGFGQIIKTLYMVNEQSSPMLLIRAICNSLQALRRNRSSTTDKDAQPGRCLSMGALVPLRRYIEAMVGLVSDAETARNLRALLNEPNFELKGGPFGVFDELFSTKGTRQQIPPSIYCRFTECCPTPESEGSRRRY